MKKFFSLVLVLVVWLLVSGEASACGKGRLAGLFHRGTSAGAGCGCSTCGTATKAKASACPNGACPAAGSVAGSAGHFLGTVTGKIVNTPIDAVQSFRAGVRGGFMNSTCPNCK